MWRHFFCKTLNIKVINSLSCFHCGDSCNNTIRIDQKYFCCNGCQQVYLLLNENNLCQYYNIHQNPGIKAKGRFTKNQYDYLNTEEIINKLVLFKSNDQVNIKFHLPQIHCSSCIFLLEHLHQIHEGIVSSQIHFQKKEIFIIYNPKEIKLSEVVELLAFVGYEPIITLHEIEQKHSTNYNKIRLYKIGIAGFCFANIMMLSFPEYFSSGNIETTALQKTFSWIIFGLSIPVLFYCASEFFISAFNGLKQKILNIDTPIALAILVTFLRSYYEIISGFGAGFLDSGSGIVFFMLIGRWFQNKTYDAFSFDRNYSSYFPLGVSVISNDEEKSIPITQLKKGYKILIRNEELIPTDSILLSSTANIDYSFVTGENELVHQQSGALIYAGGKNSGTAITLETIHEVSQSYFTQLWNNDAFKMNKNKDQSFIHPWSKYFTIVLFSIAALSTMYWYIVDTNKMWNALTAILIVACPCSLLLSATFTYGNMLRYFGRHKFFLKNSSVIESLAKAKTIVFDKTGTLTNSNNIHIKYQGQNLNNDLRIAIKLLCSQSSHPLSKIITKSIQLKISSNFSLTSFKEINGLGIEGMINEDYVRIGSSEFLNLDTNHKKQTTTTVYIEVNDKYIGEFVFETNYRLGVKNLIKSLQKSKYKLHMLSGDNNAEENRLSQLFNFHSNLNFNQSPQDKLNYIQQLQQNSSVIMLGDGLNDAGALKQSDVGIAVTENTNRFSPACDALLAGDKLYLLHQFIKYAKSGKTIITASFILSILYNIIGLSFAVQSLLSPMIAAILMPLSSISIVLFVGLLTNIYAQKILNTNY
ncbi:MAG: heavy metal translocating P-type ATPase metal-binding domain-containing protein [Chitinophagaceae bacterium]|nr:heavy metal translocating P-type ATPase metal-binding domain-containing protein [Chitinophagaceae bacterium]